MNRASVLVPAVTIAVGMLAADAANPQRAATQEEGQGQPTIAGSWTFNADESDNVRDRLNAAMRNRGNTGASMGGRAGRGSGRAGGGARGGRGGAGGVLDQSAGGVQMGPGGMNMLRGPREMRIEFTESTVIIQRDGGDALQLTTDNKPLKLLPEGRSVEYKAKWDGEKLEIETKVEDGPRVTEKYELEKNDPGTLKVEVRFTQPSPAGNLNVRLNRVYNRS